MLSVGITAATAHKGDCYAVMSGDTLRMGNSLVERAWVVNQYEVRTLWLCNKASGKYYRNNATQGDMELIKGQMEDVRFETDEVPADGIRPAHRRANISYRIGNLSVQRIYTLYADVPAIACSTLLKGRLPQTSLGQGNGLTQADRKNIEFAEDMNVAVKTPVVDRLDLGGNHWQTHVVEFFDCTDWNNNLVAEQCIVPYRRSTSRGNVLLASDAVTGKGFYFLKEAPCSGSQLHDAGADFITQFGVFAVTGFGVSADDVSPEGWTQAYTTVLGVFDGNIDQGVLALRNYQKQARGMRHQLDNMVMMNTWGDRSQDARIDEAFCLQELDRASRLGITVFQLDDGWQTGKSPNSKVAKGSFADIWKNKDYWTPDKKKFPNGLARVVEKARRLGIRVGLWFNPSIQNDFADWQKDADAVVSLWQKYGISIYKIDGLQIPTKLAEQNLRRFFDDVVARTHQEVMFNLDVTAGRRGGYHLFNEYGNIFMENRYTDWGNYYPYQTLRNLWQLSRWVPAERLQVEFLNKWRNANKYAADDVFAPAHYDFEYLFAITMMAQPLAWMEASNLPEEAYSIGGVVKHYNQLQADIHAGVILPVGEEPSGRNWTGFQSVITPTEGYVVVYRELNARTQGSLRLCVPAGRRVAFEALLGSEVSFETESDADGTVVFTQSSPNSYTLYHYTIQ